MCVSISRGEAVKVGWTLGTVKRVHKRTVVVETRGGRVRVPREDVKALPDTARCLGVG